MSTGYHTQLISIGELKKFAAPAVLSQLPGQLNERDACSLTMRDVSVAKINARIQSIALTNAELGIEFATRKVWFKFCNRVLAGEVSNSTFKVIKNVMGTWPGDLQRIWKTIITLRKTMRLEDKMKQSVV